MLPYENPFFAHVQGFFILFRVRHTVDYTSLMLCNVFTTKVLNIITEALMP